MKKTLTVFLIAATFAACKNSSKQDPNQGMIPLDTTKPYNSSVLTDTPKTSTTTTTTTVVTTTQPVTPAPVTPKASGTTTKTTSTSNTSTGNGTSTAQAPATQKKKGWSSAAKGAVIGSVGGAVLGGVIGGGKGAVIGGVVGGGGGYIIGRSKDKKSGRVTKKTTTTDTQK